MTDRSSETAAADAHAAGNRWFGARLPIWTALGEQLTNLERAKRATPDQVLSCMRVYPELARDLAIARKIAPQGQVTRHLERQYFRLHRMLYQPAFSWREDLAVLIQSELPTIIHEMRWRIVAVSLLFVASTLSGWWLITANPDLAGLFVSESMQNDVRDGRLWTEGLFSVTPPSVISVSIFTNNITVALTAASIGVLYGLGTLYIVGFNGMMLGGVFAYVAQHNLADRLLTFITAHGPVEICAICLSGAAGLYLGESLARPGRLTRTQAFRESAHKVWRVLLVCVVFLVGAGLIEGYVSPNPDVPMVLRLLIGFGYLALFLYTLAGWRLPVFNRGLFNHGRAVAAPDIAEIPEPRARPV